MITRTWRTREAREEENNEKIAPRIRESQKRELQESEDHEKKHGKERNRRT